MIDLTNAMSVGRHLNDQDTYRNTGLYILVKYHTNVMSVGEHLNDQDTYRNT